MDIATLFVNLGIKGGDQAQKSLVKVKNTLGGISTEGFAAKVAIVGAMYAIERFMAMSIKAGEAVMQFKNRTGESAKTLGEWSWYGRQSAVSAEEVAQSLESVQQHMYEIGSGQGGPSAAWDAIVGKLGQFGIVVDQPKLKNDLNYAMETLLEYKKLEQDVNRGNQMTDALGLGQNLGGAMRDPNNHFNPHNAPTSSYIGDNQAKQLRDIGVMWSNLWNTIQMKINNFNSKHGAMLVENITKIAVQVAKMVESLTKLAESMKIFQLIGKIFETANSGLDSLNQEYDQKNKDVKKGGFGFAINESVKRGYEGDWESEKKIFSKAWDILYRENTFTNPDYHPRIPKIPEKQKTTKDKVTHHAQINIHGVKGAEDAVDAIQRAVAQAFYSNANLSVG